MRKKPVRGEGRGGREREVTYTGVCIPSELRGNLCRRTQIESLSRVLPSLPLYHHIS